jgi:hypothetical protein
LAAAGFCDGGSGGPTSVLVDSSLTRAMPRCAHAGMQYAIRAAILGDANRAFANAGAGVPWREAWLSLRTGSGRGHQLVCARAQRVAAFARALCAAVQRMGISRLFFGLSLNGKVTKRPLLNYSPVRQQQEIGGDNKRAVRVVIARHPNTVCRIMCALVCVVCRDREVSCAESRLRFAGGRRRGPSTTRRRHVQWRVFKCFLWSVDAWRDHVFLSCSCWVCWKTSALSLSLHLTLHASLRVAGTAVCSQIYGTRPEYGTRGISHPRNGRAPAGAPPTSRPPLAVREDGV